jgi:hypothetical protein
MKVTKRFIFLIFISSLLSFSCSEEPPVIPPPDNGSVKNSVVLSIEWTDLYRINLKWNKAEDDTLNNFRYDLKRKDEAGTEVTKVFYLFGSDTTYTDDNDGDSLAMGTNYSYRIKAYDDTNELKDTSLTVITQTLSITSHNITWQIDTLGQPGDLGLLDVWGLDENNVWAVGGVNLLEGGTTIIKWDGMKWNYHSWPNGGARGIWGFTENDIWTVGEYSNRGFIGHYNGVNWTEYRSDYFLARGDTVYPLYAVWGLSPENVWAVGDQGTIVHWDGTEWQKVQSPVNLLLYDIWGTSSDNIYAIRISLSQLSQLIHYDGNSWTEITSQLPSGDRNFTSLWFDRGGTGYVVGNNVLHYDGGAFNRIEINQDKFLLRVRGINSTDVFTVGQKGRVYHFNGEDWITYPELNDESQGMELRGVYVTETTVFAVGIINNGAIIYRGVRL